MKTSSVLLVHGAKTSPRPHGNIGTNDWTMYQKNQCRCSSTTAENFTHYLVKETSQSGGQVHNRALFILSFIKVTNSVSPQATVTNSKSSENKKQVHPYLHHRLWCTITCTMWWKGEGLRRGRTPSKTCDNQLLHGAVPTAADNTWCLRVSREVDGTRLS